MTEDHTPNQHQLLSFLSSPDAYPHQPETVEIVQTHISIVALAPPFVYKFKKPVDLGFLNFSTLPRRLHYCREEIRLNRRLCSDIYLGVIPLYACDAPAAGEDRSTEPAFSFEGGPRVVDYAVKMKQLSESHFLDQLLNEGQIDDRDLDRIIDVLARFYAAQNSPADVAQWGAVDRIAISINENFDQTQSFVGDLIPAELFEAVKYFSERFLTMHRAQFEARVDQGRILDCHGDLRLEHIHLSPDRVCIYDCIEFNERFRYIDVANDLAFLTMDFDHHGYPNQGTYVKRRLAERLSDPALLQLIPFYASYRAYVRGKVEAIKSEEKEVSSQDLSEARQAALSYFRLALWYALFDHRPYVLVVMGRIGTGKSTQANALAELLGWPVVSSDKTRKEIAGLPLFQRTPEEQRPSLYSNSMTEQTYGQMFESARAALRTGTGVLLDATFGKPDHRQQLARFLREEFAQEEQVPVVFIELRASDETIQQRLEERMHEADVVSDARLDDFERLSDTYVPPDEEEGVLRVEAGSLETNTLRICTMLVDRHLENMFKEDAEANEVRS